MQHKKFNQAIQSLHRVLNPFKNAFELIDLNTPAMCDMTVEDMS